MDKEKKVMLYSGGFDSRLQLPFIDPDVLLYVDLKTQYSDKERYYLKHMLPGKYKKRVVIAPNVDLEMFEGADFYLPFRNAILGLLAAQFGQHIYFGFNASDNAPDKDVAFLTQLRILTQTMGKPRYVPESWVIGTQGYNINYYAPFRLYTKTEMVKRFLEEKKGTKTLLQDIRSCYSEHSWRGCGTCSPCVHKAVALLNNDISLKGVFDEEITENTLDYWINKHTEWRPGNKVLKDFKDAYKRISI